MENYVLYEGLGNSEYILCDKCLLRNIPRLKLQ